jgi:hypothetical protein
MRGVGVFRKNMGYVELKSPHVPVFFYFCGPSQPKKNHIPENFTRPFVVKHSSWRIISIKGNYKNMRHRDLKGGYKNAR